MARSVINKKIEYTLVLDEQEARWLRGLMQNPIFDEEPDEEPELDRTMRETIWTALAIDKF